MLVINVMVIDLVIVICISEAPSSTLSKSNELYPKWAIDEAEIYIQRALKRTVHIMEIVQKSKKSPYGNDYRKYILKILQSDSRLQFSKDKMTFTAALGNNFIQEDCIKNITMVLTNLKL